MRSAFKLLIAGFESGIVRRQRGSHSVLVKSGTWIGILQYLGQIEMHGGVLWL